MAPLVAFRDQKSVEDRGGFATEHFPQVNALGKKVVLFRAAFTGERALPAPAGVSPASSTQQKQH